MNRLNVTLNGLAAVLFVGQAALADDAVLNIKSQTLASALREFSERTGLQIGYASNAVEGKTSHGVYGIDSPDIALQTLLADTGLEYRFINESTVVIQETAAVSTQRGASDSKNSSRMPAVTAQNQSTSPRYRSKISDNETPKDNLPPKIFDEIIVTASRRDESLQESTFSASVLSGDALDADSPASFADFINYVPSVSLVGRGEGRSRLSIRGISALNLTGGATVGTYVNESFVGDEFSLTPELATFDLQSIEILRGPQGSLFGRASLGGTFRLITKRPNPERFEGKVRLSASDTDRGGTGYDAAGVLNMPLADTSALRIVGTHRTTPGYVDNPLRNTGEIDESVVNSGRASLLYRPTEQFSIEASVTLQDGELGSAAPVDPRLPEYQLRQRFDDIFDDDLSIANLLLTYRAQSFDIVSSTNWFQREIFSFNAVDFPVLGIANDQTQDSESEALSQEIRIVSTSDGRLSWTAGLYWSETESDLVFTIKDAKSSSPATVSGDGDEDSIKSYAVFGEITAALSRRWRMTLGGRYNEEKVDRFSVRVENSNFSPKFTLAFTPREDALLYLTAAHGFRTGGVNGFITPASPSELQPFRTFEPDTLWNYELGVKTTWNDGRLLFNAAAFVIDWSDAQIPIPIPGQAPFLTPISTAGDVTSRGIEVEFRAIPIDRLNLSLTASWLDAEFDQDSKPLRVSAGDPFPFSFDSNLSAAFSYSLPIADGWDASIGANVNYVGKGFAGVGTGDPIGDYTLVNVNAGLNRGPWGIQLFGNNVFNSDGLQNVESSRLARFAGRPDSPYRFINRPRTFGLRLLAHF